MKTVSFIPVLSIVLILFGAAVAVPEDESLYIQDRTLPPSLSTPEEDYPGQEVPPEDIYNGENGEAFDMDKPLRGDGDRGPGIKLLPEPQPVEQPRPYNGELEINGEAVPPALDGDGEGDVLYRSPEPGGAMTRHPQGRVRPVPGWPQTPYEEYLYNEEERPVPADGERTNGERTKGEIRTNGELRDQTVYPEPDWSTYPDGEWQEMETNGDDTVTPYTDEEMEYEDRDGDDDGWYDDDADTSPSRTGYRFGWPGQK